MIRTDIDLIAALDDLVAIDPRFADVRVFAGTVPLSSIEPGIAGLAWVITGQRISTFAQEAIYARMDRELGGVTVATVLGASDAQFRRAGQSNGKIRTLRIVAAAISAEELDLAALAERPSEEAIAALTALPGIGRWTAESFLLFAAGHRDVFPAADVALQEAARVVFALQARPSAAELLAHAEAWRPLRAVAARLLWAYYVTGREARRRNARSA